MVECGVPLLWINPSSEQLGAVSVLASPDAMSHLFGQEIVWRDGYDKVEVAAPPLPDAVTASFRCVPIRQCRLGRDGVWLPGQRDEVANRHLIESVNESRRRKDDGRRQAVEDSFQRSAGRRAVINIRREQRRSCETRTWPLAAGNYRGGRAKMRPAFSRRTNSRCVAGSDAEPGPG
jgi:hypothetical protein